MSTRVKSMAGKRRFWLKHTEAWRQSGQSQREYCSRHDLAISTFQLWRRRLAGAHGISDLEVVALPRLQTPAAPVLVLVLDDGRSRLEIHDGVRAETLREVLQALAVRG